jgi:molybdopterin-guanine dinucleotide biosynthesis protein B
MRVLGIAGFSGSGKTTLVIRLLPHLAAGGLEVATLKHVHHDFDPLPSGHASQDWRAAGAREIVLAGPKRRMLLHELRGEPEPAIETVLPLLSPVDLLLIEGYKFGPHDKLEVFRRDNGSPLLAASDPRVIALMTDCGRPGGLPPERDLPIFAIDDVATIAGFIAALCGAAAKKRAGGPTS